MKLEALQHHLLAKAGVTEERPFGPEALVYKVAGKMFGLIAWQETPLRITLKCDPDLALLEKPGKLLMLKVGDDNPTSPACLFSSRLLLEETH